MDRFYVNNNAHSTGEHEVHREGCKRLEPSVTTFLGEFPCCSGAIEKARAVFATADGCFFCTYDCHWR